MYSTHVLDLVFMKISFTCHVLDRMFSLLPACIPPPIPPPTLLRLQFKGLVDYEDEDDSDGEDDLASPNGTDTAAKRPKLEETALFMHKNCK